MTDYNPPLVSILVLDYLKKDESRLCLESIRKHLKIPHKIVYLDNGGREDYSWLMYKEGLCDVLISKKVGMGGGYGQTDLFRWCDTKYSIFVQNDQVLSYDIDQIIFDRLINLLHSGFKCVDLNGDQSGSGIWTDRAHLIETDFFNSLAPFPNGGPGNDAQPWNEEFLQKKFKENEYQIAHIVPSLFIDNGKWSIRQAGDGLFKHRCDTKKMWILKVPTKKTEVYPPFTDEEWDLVLNGKWIDGEIPKKWKQHSFEGWKNE